MARGSGRGGRNRAFVAREAAALTLAAALVGCVGAVGMGQGRRAAGLAGSLANLRKIGETTGMYGADFGDQLWSFTWRPGYAPSGYADLQNPSDGTAGAAFQAVDIVRRLYRDDFPRFDDRLGTYALSTLVLADFLQESLPLEWAVSPGDAVRLAWQADPDDPPALGEQGGEAWDAMFCAFGSSYELMPAWWAPDERADGRNTVAQYGPNHKLTSVPNGLNFGGRTAAEVAHPARKVHMAETGSYFFGPRVTFYLHQAARVPVLMADGAASARSSADANASFRPNSPDNVEGTSTTSYVPNLIYDPATLSGGPSDPGLDTHYKWTRHGLLGIDFSGERAE